MTLWTLIRRSLRLRARAHLGVVLGAMVGSAALIGALVVGDSVRGSLRELALQRLGWVDVAMDSGDRFFTQSLGERFTNELRVAGILRLPGTAVRQDGAARANQVNVIGVSAAFWGSNVVRLAQIPTNTVVLNPSLAAQLRAQPGDELVLRIHKPSALSREAPISPRSDASVALRVTVHAIAAPKELGNFNLRANHAPPLNAFVRLDDLDAAAGLEGKANLMLVGGPAVQSLTPGEIADALNLRLQNGSSLLADAELELREISDRVELRTSRIFLEPPILHAAAREATVTVDRYAKETDNEPPPTSVMTLSPKWLAVRQSATNPAPILTYLVNQLRVGERSTPYSMVTAAGPPWTPAGMADDEILVNEWLAADLQLKPGDTLDLTYYMADAGAQLVERTNRFRVRGVVPISGVYSDRTLMPEFPGLAKAESTSEWDAGFPLVHKIRDEDDKYWKQYRGTPKAFITLTAGQRLWTNRFGSATAIRWAVPTNATPNEVRAVVERNLLANLTPAEFGLRFEPVREQALRSSEQSQDFGGLFLGFSMFLIIAALILMALLFQFGLEQRAEEVGTLLALGFTPKRLRRLLWLEGMTLAFFGGVIGVIGGIGYARALLHGLTTVWRDAVGTSALEYHARPVTLGIGLMASVLVGVITIAFVLRRQARRPARELLAEGGGQEFQIASFKTPVSSRVHWIALGSGVAAIGAVGWAMATGRTASAGIFFGAGSLLLVSGVAGTAVLLGRLAGATAASKLSLSALGLRGTTRRRKRSLAVVGLLACGSFLIAAIGVFRLEAIRDAFKRSSGTGGFALIGESTLPVVQDLNSKTGREFFGLNDRDLSGVAVVPLRVRDGDEASCLNLNRAQTPRLLGIDPELLARRGAFTFASVTKGLSADRPWMLLQGARRSAGNPGQEAHASLSAAGDQGRVLAAATSQVDDAVPAIGDAASIQWALHKRLGDTLDFVDERGNRFQIRLVGGLANSILQGNLLIDEREFLKRFPGETGYRMFLIDAPSNSVPQVSAAMTRALQDMGFEATPAAKRLAAFNAVQNTYLNTFQVLGGLGLLLGSAGLGVVVLRNVLDRRGELALLQAVGFRRRALQWLVLSEHGALLGIGFGVGLVSALVAILPVLLTAGAETQFRSLLGTLLGALGSGMIWTWVATWFALRGKLVESLRNE